MDEPLPSEIHREKVDTDMKRLQQAVDDRIESEVRPMHPIEWQAAARRVAEEILGNTGWEYVVSTPICDVPIIILTSYDMKKEERGGFNV